MVARETVKNFYALKPRTQQKLSNHDAAKLWAENKKLQGLRKAAKKNPAKYIHSKMCIKVHFLSLVLYSGIRKTSKKHQTAGFCLQVLYASLVELCAFLSQLTSVGSRKRRNQTVFDDFHRLLYSQFCKHRSEERRKVSTRPAMALMGLICVQGF